MNFEERAAAIDEIRKDSNEVLKIIYDYEKERTERNAKKNLLVEQLRDLLPEDQFKHFQKYINSIPERESLPKTKKQNNFQVDENNPIESLREIRSNITSGR